MGGVRRIAPSYHAGELASCVGVSLWGFKVFAAFAANWGIHLAAILRLGWLGKVGRPTYAALWFANP
jgi:hypothetical protein